MVVDGLFDRELSLVFLQHAWKIWLILIVMTLAENEIVPITERLNSYEYYGNDYFAICSAASSEILITNYMFL